MRLTRGLAFTAADYTYRRCALFIRREPHLEVSLGRITPVPDFLHRRIFTCKRQWNLPSGQAELRQEMWCRADCAILIVGAMPGFYPSRPASSRGDAMGVRFMVTPSGRGHLFFGGRACLLRDKHRARTMLLPSSITKQEMCHVQVHVCPRRTSVRENSTSAVHSAV